MEPFCAAATCAVDDHNELPALQSSSPRARLQALELFYPMESLKYFSQVTGRRGLVIGIAGGLVIAGIAAVVVSPSRRATNRLASVRNPLWKCLYQPTSMQPFLPSIRELRKQRWMTRRTARRRWHG
jgi:hypothetical protein